MRACCPLLLLALAWGAGAAGAGAAGAASAITAQTLSPCYSADLKPTSGRLVSAVGCTVLLAAPPLNASTVVCWEYENGPHEGIILKYYLNKPVNTAPSYQNRTKFNETDFSLQMVLQLGDSGRYRFATEAQQTDWFQLEAIEPLPAPEIVGNSSVKAGGNAKLVCSIPEGKADSYWWKKNGELLLGSDHLQFIQNNTLLITEATMNDSGYYTCVVRNEVSQNETSFLLRVLNAANMIFPVIMACVVVGSLIGVFVWCKRRGCLRHCDRRWRA